jgi:hypothetical protein
MALTKSPAPPTESIERLFTAFMKANAATIEGKYEQFPRLRYPTDFDKDGSYRARPLLEHLFAIASFLGGDIEDRFEECLAATETVTFRPENWVPDEDEDEEEPKQQAAE